jgi:hypothetical protein
MQEDAPLVRNAGAAGQQLLNALRLAELDGRASWPRPKTGVRHDDWELLDDMCSLHCLPFRKPDTAGRFTYGRLNDALAMSETPLVPVC